MNGKNVEFQFITGLARPIFRNARLRGSWDATGNYSDTWTEYPMEQGIGSDGCPIFTATISLDSTNPNTVYKWGISVDGPLGANTWGIPTELNEVDSVQRYRQFSIRQTAGNQVEAYFLTYLRRLGANKYFVEADATPGLRFAVWAPNAQRVAVVFGDPASGYITSTGLGVDPSKPVIELTNASDGIWEGIVDDDFDTFKSLPYMYRIVNAQGDTVYRTDIYSRSQLGRGDKDPSKVAWSGTVDSLDGGVSCSVVIDADVVRPTFDSTPAGSLPDLIPADEFWATEFTLGLPVATALEDLVIYELHVGSLGFGKETPGNLSDAIDFLDHLVDLGVNAVELLPMAEFSGSVSWGYGDTHHLCIESSAGGRDKYRHFVRECHRRGIAVIQDVVYNHYDPNAERAQWDYDSTDDEQNIYYWYEGQATDYAKSDGGYLDNGSTGFTPRFWEEVVRQQFISSAAFLIEEMHVDGLRVDLTQAIHRDNTLHADANLPGTMPRRSSNSARVYGQKFLREWSRTLTMIRPSVMLIAEDHTGWDAVTKLPAQGGLGFRATWQLAYYHNLIGDSDMAGDAARLLKQAGFGGNEALRMDAFAGALFSSQYNRVVFHESHDEAGNAGGTARTLVTAVNNAALVGPTRRAAESRSRLCVGLSLLSAGTPMFFMGEEIGAQKKYTYDKFIQNRENILGEKLADGKALFRFYQELISLSRRLRAIRSANIDILHVSNQNRVIAFKRWKADEQIIIVASFNNSPFSTGYEIQKDTLGIPDGRWREVFNSDAAVYNGQNTGNFSAAITSVQGRINVNIPANGFVVFIKQ